jgi:hypothetical protein
MNASLAVRATRRLAAVALLPAALALAPIPARALTHGPYTLEVLVDGRPLDELYGRGRTYLEAIAGHEYSLRLTNNTGRRVAMAVSVDGLNTIDARTTTAQAGAKWILAPYESIVLDGWQTSSMLARHFYFTSEQGSYGAWLGRTLNLGVIVAAVFRERHVSPPPRPLIDGERGAPGGPAEGAEGAGPGAASEAPLAPPPSAKSEAGRQAGGDLEPRRDEPPISDDLAATGIGREVDHPVEHVRFNSERTAAAVLELRYEYRPALVKLGLLPRAHSGDPLQRRERAHGFDPGFAPDPYRHPGGSR